MLVILRCFTEVNGGDILQAVQTMVGTHLSMGFSVSALCQVENQISCVERVQKHQVLLIKEVGGQITARVIACTYKIPDT